MYLTFIMILIVCYFPAILAYGGMCSSPLGRIFNTMCILKYGIEISLKRLTNYNISMSIGF